MVEVDTVDIVDIRKGVERRLLCTLPYQEVLRRFGQDEADREVFMMGQSLQDVGDLNGGHAPTGSKKEMLFLVVGMFDGNERSGNG